MNISGTALKQIQPGTRVGFIYGPGEFASDNPGTVTGYVEDRWGSHLTVEMDEGVEHQHPTVHNITDKGIGCYLI